MRCEYCDSVIKNVPDNGICPNCGGVLPGGCDNEAAKGQFLEPPIGIYTGIGGDFVEIGESYVRFFVKIPFSADSDITLPFGEIYTVRFEPYKGISKLGFLCVRERNKLDVPLPESTRELYKENCIIRFSDNDIFFNIYMFLKNCADINNGSAVEKPDK